MSVVFGRDCAQKSQYNSVMSAELTLMTVVLFYFFMLVCSLYEKKVSEYTTILRKLTFRVTAARESFVLCIVSIANFVPSIFLKRRIRIGTFQKYLKQIRQQQPQNFIFGILSFYLLLHAGFPEVPIGREIRASNIYDCVLLWILQLLLLFSYTHGGLGDS